MLVKGSADSRLLTKAVKISVFGQDRAGKPLKVLSPEMRQIFGSFNGGDQRAIAAALKATGVNWDQQKLNALRTQAVMLVRAERRAIMRVANELLRLRTLSVDEIRRLVG